MLYKQLSDVENNAWDGFRLEHPWALIFAVIFVLPNIWFAYVKWKTTLRIMNLSEDKNRSIQSFFAGVVTGMITPNMLGNFIGRFYYFEKEYRPTITILTLFSNFAQLLATLIFGVISAIILGQIYLVGEGNGIIGLLITSTIIAFIAYFFADLILNLFKKRINIFKSRELLKEHTMYRWKMIGYSMLRFLIFTLQFSLVIYSFGEEYSVQLILSIWQVYMITLLIPSLFLGKLGIKEYVAITVLGGLGMNEFSILFTSLIIWFMNSLTPTLVGLIICKPPRT